MDEYTNPYRPGAGTSPPALLGRDVLITHFDTTVRRALARRPGKSLMPIGLRGVGKTVLLNRFAEIAERQDFAIGFIEAQEVCRTDPPSSERIASVDDEVFWKVKIELSAWPGPVTGCWDRLPGRSPSPTTSTIPGCRRRLGLSPCRSTCVGASRRLRTT